MDETGKTKMGFLIGALRSLSDWLKAFWDIEDFHLN